MTKRSKVVLVGLVFLITAGYFGLKAYAAHVAEKNVSQAASRVSGFVDLDYQQVSVDLFGMDTHIKNVRISGLDRRQTLKIDDIVIYRAAHQGKVPESLHVRFNGINVDLDQMGKNAAALRQLGYSRLKADTELDYTYDPAQRTLEVTKFQTGAAELGDVMMTCRIKNIDLSPASLPFLFFTFPNILVDRAEVTYTDHSLVRRLLEAAAQKNGQTYEGFSKDLNADLDKEIAAASDPFTIQVMNSIQAFLNNPTAITFSVLPDKPVSIGKLQNMTDRDELIKLLNAKASVD